VSNPLTKVDVKKHGLETYFDVIVSDSSPLFSVLVLKINYRYFE